MQKNKIESFDKRCHMGTLGGKGLINNWIIGKVSLNRNLLATFTKTVNWFSFYIIPVSFYSLCITIYLYINGNCSNIMIDP